MDKARFKKKLYICLAADAVCLVSTFLSGIMQWYIGALIGLFSCIVMALILMGLVVSQAFGSEVKKNGC